VIADIGGALECIPQQVDFSSPQRDRHLHWKNANRYGIAIEMIDETYRIIWFRPEEVPIAGQSLFFGGGSVDFDLARGSSEPLSREKAKRLGITWE
jgi:hypothetical protein